MIFGVWNPGEIWHENLTDSPPCMSDVTIVPWEIPKKSFSTVLFTHTSDYLRYLTRQQSVIHLPTPPENVTTLTWELQNFFIWLKVCCVLSSCWWAPWSAGRRRLWNACWHASERSADVSTCMLPWTLSSYGDRTFAAAGPCLWNSLPAA